MAGRARTPGVVARALFLAAVGVVVLAPPAAADAPAPGPYESEVIAVAPPVDGIDVEVVGGDSFLVLEADAGTEVVVLGYEDEPFLRIRSDGTVEQNANSPATYLNDDRYAEAPVPARLVGVDPAELEPEWESVASGGTYAWHDHRIHWMAPNAPPAVPRGGSFDWNGTVPLLVDGARVEISGVIHYRDAVSPLPWIALGLAVAAAGWFLLRRRLRAAALVGLAAGAAGAIVAVGTSSAAPPGVGTSALPVVAAGVACALGASALPAPARIRSVVLLAAAAVLGSWSLLRSSVLTEPVLPTGLPFALDRAVTAVALGVAVAIAAVAVAAGTPPLAEPDEGQPA